MSTAPHVADPENMDRNYSQGRISVVRELDSFTSDELISAHEKGVSKGHQLGYQEGVATGVQVIVETLIESKQEYERGREEQRDLWNANFHRTMDMISADIVEKLKSKCEMPITRIVFGLNSPPLYKLLLFVDRKIFFSDDVNVVISLAIEHCERAASDFVIMIDASFIAEAGSMPVSHLQADGYSHYLWYGLHGNEEPTETSSTKDVSNS